MITVAEARQALADAEQRVTEADADCVASEAEFKRAPSARTHTATAVATQVAANFHVALEQARAQVVEAERAVQLEAIKAAVARAQPAALYERTAPTMERIRALHAEIEACTAEITTACAEQHAAVREAETIARSLGVAVPIPRRVALSFLRAIVGTKIARDVYRRGSKFELGLEPHTFVEPRAPLPYAHPRAEELRQARAVALPASEFIPAPEFDFLTSHHDGPFFYHHKVAARPQRYEV